MKSIDIKSVIIGILGTILVFVSIGATDKNLGDITVSSIAVVDENGKLVGSFSSNEYGGNLRIGHTNGKLVSTFSSDKNGASLMISNTDGKLSGVFSSDEDGGSLAIFNSDEKLAAVLSPRGGGLLKVYNKHGEQVGYFGVNKDQDGMITLSDRYGDTGWGESGKK